MGEQILAFTGGATEETQQEILDFLKVKNQFRLDYTGGPAVGDPVYIGKAEKTALESDPTWSIQKLSYTDGQVTKIETREDTTWVGRANPTPNWE